MKTFCKLTYVHKTTSKEEDPITPPYFKIDKHVSHIIYDRHSRHLILHFTDETYSGFEIDKNRNLDLIWSETYKNASSSELFWVGIISAEEYKEMKIKEKQEYEKRDKERRREEYRKLKLEFESTENEEWGK